MIKQFNFKQFNLACHLFALSLNVKQFYRTLTGATTPGQSGPRGNGNEGTLNIPQNSSITRASPSDCLVSYPGHALWESYLSADMQSVYSTSPANWANICMLVHKKRHSEIFIIAIKCPVL